MNDRKPVIGLIENKTYRGVSHTILHIPMMIEEMAVPDACHELIRKDCFIEDLVEDYLTELMRGVTIPESVKIKHKYDGKLKQRMKQIIRDYYGNK